MQSVKISPCKNTQGVSWTTAFFTSHRRTNTSVRYVETISDFVVVFYLFLSERCSIVRVNLFSTIYIYTVTNSCTDPSQAFVRKCKQVCASIYPWVALHIQYPLSLNSQIHGDTIHKANVNFWPYNTGLLYIWSLCRRSVRSLSNGGHHETAKWGTRINQSWHSQQRTNRGEQREDKTVLYFPYAKQIVTTSTKLFSFCDIVTVVGISMIDHTHICDVHKAVLMYSHGDTKKLTNIQTVITCYSFIYI